MGRHCVEKPVKHVISVRVNDLEKEALEDLAQGLGVNISTLLRKALNTIAKETGNQPKRILAVSHHNSVSSF